MFADWDYIFRKLRAGGGRRDKPGHDGVGESIISALGRGARPTRLGRAARDRLVVLELDLIERHGHQLAHAEGTADRSILRWCRLFVVAEPDVVDRAHGLALPRSGDAERATISRPPRSTAAPPSTPRARGSAAVSRARRTHARNALPQPRHRRRCETRRSRSEPNCPRSALPERPR